MGESAINHLCPTNTRSPRMSTMKLYCEITVNENVDVEEFKAKALELVDFTRNYPGCVDCYFCQEIGNESVFTFMDTWESEAAFDKKMGTEAVGNFLKEFEDNITIYMKRFSVC